MLTNYRRALPFDDGKCSLLDGFMKFHLDIMLLLVAMVVGHVGFILDGLLCRLEGDVVGWIGATAAVAGKTGAGLAGGVRVVKARISGSRAVLNSPLPLIS